MNRKSLILLGILVFGLVFLSCRKTKKETNGSEVQPKEEVVDTTSTVVDTTATKDSIQ